MEKLLSIIVPVYNKELFLKNCIESINNLNIDKNQIEAIFVDDCSNDKSQQIIKSYLNKYDFLKLVIMEVNTGSPAVPRNIGINDAQGKYITFLDADDWLDETGLPKLVKQAQANDADVAFGHSIKHTEKAVTKLGRFTSYKEANHLVPYEINKIFRAVGPPGKIIKTDILKQNHIQFQHYKFGEDKLFFIEAISKCQNASMNPMPVYHVNRFSQNESLVGETSIIEKTECNLEILEEVLKLSLPKSTEFQALSRIIEVDFIARLFNRKRFLKHPNKEIFYQLFDEMLAILDRYNKNGKNYITADKYKNIYQFLINKEYDLLHDYVKLLTKGGNANKFVKDNQIYFAMPEHLRHCIPVKEEMFAVYEGTHFIDHSLKEVIRIYKNSQVHINKVVLMELYNEPNEQEIPYTQEGNYIYLDSETLSQCDFDFNINIIHDEYKPCIVNMNMPNASKNTKLKRQKFKAEFLNKQKTKSKKPAQYFKYQPLKVKVIKKIYQYKDIEFKHRTNHEVNIGDTFNIVDTEFTKKGIPRLITEDGLVITANKAFVDEVIN